MMQEDDAAKVSRLLWLARESVSMYVDVVESQTGQWDEYQRGLVQEIDDYRALRGWDPNGFGGEVG